MSKPVDPFELLRRLNPVEPNDFAGEAASPEAQRTLEQIVADARTRSRRLSLGRLPRLRLRRRVYLLALVPLAGVVAAAAWALTHGATKQFTIGCYASPDLQAHTVVVASGDVSPIGTCRTVWERGDFGNQPTPPLQACVLPSGGIGVFPGSAEATCKQLHLAPLTPTTAPPSRTRSSPSPLVLKNALTQKFLASPCMGAQQALTVVQDEISRLNLSSWAARQEGTFTSKRPCASLGFDEQQHRVLLIPMPTRP